ncbi:MAG: POTRA domain-containing protein [Terracidiphilus sp.]
MLLVAISVCVTAHPAVSQKFLPKTIKFQGDPEYSDAELLAAAGLKKGVVLGYTEMQDYCKRLLATGAFSTVAFKFDGQDLIFMLAPSTDLFPVRLENLPLNPGKDLDAKLHDQVPLYHGLVPAEGGLTDDLATALQKMLAAEGLQTTVIATTAADQFTHKVNAVSYSITAPPVMAGVAQIDGVSDAFQTRVQRVLSEAVKIPFSTMDSTGNLERAVEQFYSDQGYAAAKVQVARSGDPTTAPEAITVPFAVRVEEGRVYTVTSIQLPPGTPVTQAEIDKTLALMPGGPPLGVRVRTIWMLIASRYHDKGYLDCKVTPHANINDADATVTYNVDVDPGAVYHLAFVKFDNVSDELRSHLIHNWEMMPGDPFDESYVANFIVKVQLQDPALRQTLAGVKAKFDVTANPNTHDVNVVIRLER